MDSAHGIDLDVANKLVFTGSAAASSDAVNESTRWSENRDAGEIREVYDQNAPVRRPGDFLELSDGTTALVADRENTICCDPALLACVSRYPGPNLPRGRARREKNDCRSQHAGQSRGTARRRAAAGGQRFASGE
jgi:hypothetical protein